MLRPDERKQRKGTLFHETASLCKLEMRLFSALPGVLMLMADGARGLQFSPQIGLCGGAGIALSADDDLYIALVENLHGTAAHSAGDDDFHAAVSQEPVPRR